MFMVHVLLCAAVADLESLCAAVFAARSAAARRVAVKIMSLSTHAARWLATLLSMLLREWCYMQSERRLQGALRARHLPGVVMDAP